MSAQVPGSSLTTQQLLALANFREELADDLDQAFVDAGDTGDIATARLLGRVTAGTGPLEDLTGAQATTLLSTFSRLLKGLVPASGGSSGTLNFLREDGSWATPPGSTGSAEVINVTQAPYSATGDGTTDDTAAIVSAITAAITAKKPVYFPRPSVAYKLTNQGTTGGGIAYCINVAATDDLKLIGDNAKIIYPSNTTYGFLFLSTCNRVTVEGLRFEGSGSADMTLNYRAPFYFSASCPDIDISRCYFTGCTAASFGSDGAFPGRFRFDNNRCINGTGAISGNAYSIITNNWFINDTNTDTGSHYVYLYGPSQGCIVTGNVFTNNSQNAIQIRAGQARYQQKRGFVVANNVFIGNTVGVYIGSDDTTEVGGVVVNSNYFYNTSGPVIMQGLRDAVCSNNQIVYSWENVLSTSIGAAAITVSAAPNQNGHWCNSVATKVIDNNLIVRHPYYGVITVNSLPTAGQTLTVGGVVYTWGATALLPNQLEIQSTIAECADEIVYVLQGNRYSLQNPVMRDMHDAFNATFGYDGAATNTAIVVSGTTFAMSTTSGGTAITAATAGLHPPYAIAVENAIWPAIQGNTCTDFYDGVGVVCTRSIAPNIIDNTCIGTTMAGQANVFSTYRNNKFVVTPSNAPATGGDKRWLILSDGFPVVDNDRLAVAQEACNPQMMGTTCTVPVGDGKAIAYLWYGQETFDALDPSDPNSLPFRWDDGDEVYLDDGAATSVSFTFKRTAPGAGQFNTAAGLVALINAEAAYNATFAYYENVGLTADPSLMIKVTHAAGGTAGNTHRLYVTRTNTVDNHSYRTVGLVLKNRYASENFARFRGGAATLIKTPFFSPLASTMTGVTVTGVDAASVALAPAAYISDIIPGVGGTITHTGAAGTESFIVRVGR